MRKMIMILSLMTVLFLSISQVLAAPSTTTRLAARTSPQSSQSITSTNPAKPIYVSYRHAVFSIYLQANRTTGYSWFLKNINSRLFRVVRHRYIAPDNRRPGAAGYSVWTFRTLAPFLLVPRVGKITLVYMQPWNHKDARDVEFRIFSKQK